MADKEYIEREAAINEFNLWFGGVSHAVAAKELLNSLPAADVAEVRRGEWVEYQVPHIILCSECDWGTGVEERHQFKYCPKCGADMRGKKEV